MSRFGYFLFTNINCQLFTYTLYGNRILQVGYLWCEGQVTVLLGMNVLNIKFGENITRLQRRVIHVAKIMLRSEAPKHENLVGRNSKVNERFF